MKWMIASDLHGSAFYCKKMIKAFERERADRLLLLGDLLYHGPRNDLPEGYAPKEVIPLLNGLKPALLCVRGNCDAEVDQMVLDFPILADYAVLQVVHRVGVLPARLRWHGRWQCVAAATRKIHAPTIIMIFFLTSCSSLFMAM